MRSRDLTTVSLALSGVLLGGGRWEQEVHGQVLIVDHTAVARYAEIPQEWIEAVKKMWLDIPGESHSYGYRLGCQLLQDLDSRFQAGVTESGTPEAYTTNHMRISRATWGDVTDAAGWIYSYGEEDWYTSSLAVERTKAHISYCNTHNLEIAALGFGWCWDMTWHNPPGGGIDPVYQVHWAGSSVGGPDGDLRWGLDAGDYALTTNRVCMDTYLQATQCYIDYCKTNGFQTRVFFTTGPVDGDGESGYQRHLKQEFIRNHVKSTSDGILFDYGDILCWSDGGQLGTTTWTDYGGTLRTFPIIHPDNMLDLDGTYTEDGDHIGQRGALRLGKALWYMLARIAGWNPQFVASISVGAAPNVIVQWQSTSNQVYSVMQSADPSSAVWEVIATNLVATPPLNCYTARVEGAGASFFRVRKD